MSNEKSEDGSGGGGVAGSVSGKPLELDWCCGVNTKLDVIDLTTPEKDYTIAFGANHLVVLQVGTELEVDVFTHLRIHLITATTRCKVIVTM